MKVLILVPGPQNTLPSQRFRVEQYLRNANNQSVKFTTKSFYSSSTWKILYKPGHTIQKILGVLLGFINRFFLMFTLFEYDYVYIHREATSVGPPIIEWIIAKVWGKKIIYDFDDSIWVDASSLSNPMAARVKCAWKVKHICSWSYTITVGNNFLADYARQFCDDVRIIPTVVDTENKHKFQKIAKADIPTIGWTGTFTNFDQFEIIADTLKKLEQKHAFRLLIIADKDPKFTKFNYEFLPWKADTEVEDLMKFDIGLMPLQDKIIQHGKCAFKAIQYMSLGIPSVVSPVGANCTVVEDGVSGLWAKDENAWYQNLELLLTNSTVRSNIGTASRKRIIDKYSVVATIAGFYNLFAAYEPTTVFKPATGAYNPFSVQTSGKLKQVMPT